MATLKTFSDGDVLEASDVDIYLLTNYVWRTTDSTPKVNNTLADDSQLTTTLAASTTYLVEFCLQAASIDAAKIKCQWTVPASAVTPGLATVTVAWYGPSASANDSNMNDVNSTWRVVDNSTTVPVFGTRDSASNKFVIMSKGILTTSGSGTLALSWAQSSTNATGAVMGAGSFMKVVKLA